MATTPIYTGGMPDNGTLARAIAEMQAGGGSLTTSQVNNIVNNGAATAGNAMLTSAQAAALTGGVGGSNPVRTTQSRLKRLGTGGASGVTATASLATTWMIKICCESDFDQVRLWIPNYEVGTPTVIGCIAATESFGSSGYGTTTWNPYVGGSAVTTLDSSSDYTGWRSLNQSASRNIVLTTSPGLFADGSTKRPAWTATDWADCPSVPSNDRAAYPNLRYLLIRIFIAAAQPYNYCNTQSAGTPRDFSTPDSIDRGRTVMIARTAGADYATDPTTAGNLPSAGSQGPYFPCIVEYRARQKGISIAHVGDSLTAYLYGNSTDGGTLDMIYSPVHRACAIASTAQLPMEPVNVGFPAKTSATYQQAILDMITAGIKPNVVIYTTYCPNDLATNAGVSRITMRKQLRQLAELADAVSAYGGTVITYTPQPYGSLSAANDAERQWLAAQISLMAAQGRVRVLPVRETFTLLLGAAPETWVTAWNWDLGSAKEHWNDLGVEVVAQLMATELLRVVSQ